MCFWVCVSEDFDRKGIIKAIVESVSGGACDNMEIDPLQKRLQDMLKGKKVFSCFR